jgi:hypothetical protein
VSQATVLGSVVGLSRRSCSIRAKSQRAYIEVLGDPDMQISRIRLSDKTSRLHPRHVVPEHQRFHLDHRLLGVLSHEEPEAGNLHIRV